MKALIVLIASLLLAACARPAPEGVTVLTYATPYPPSHPFSKADQRWIEYVERESGGRLMIRPVWSGALLSSDMSLEELRHGVADIGLITPIYTRGGTHLTRIQSGFYSGADSIESQLALYQCLVDRLPEMRHEMDGLVVLAVQGGLLPGVLTRSQPVRKLADLRGMRIRAPTELLAVLDTLRALHLVEVANYFYELKVPRGAYPARAMNEKRWRSLEEWQRELLQRSKPVWEAALADEIRRSEAVGRAAGKGKIMFSLPDPAEQQRFDEVYLKDAAVNARRLEQFGIDGPTAFRLARNSVVGRDTIRCGGVS